MKKKGLIISTVVMVVVLIASLTTATYAWFSSSATATVSNITMNVGAATSVQIGLGTGTAATGYHYGDNASYTKDGGWTAANTGLGISINTGLSMDITAGVGSGTENTDDATKADKPYLMDATYDAAHTLYKGSGDFPNGDNTDKLTGITPAIVNAEGQTDTNVGKTDVVFLQMGIRPAQADVFGTYCQIVVTPDSEFVGMAAALHFEITVGTGDTAKVWTGDLLSGVKFDTATPADPYKYFFMINDAQATALGYGDAGTITEFSIRFFVSGYDTDCCNAATGRGATISINFGGADTASTVPTLGADGKAIGTQLTLTAKS